VVDGVIGHRPTKGDEVAGNQSSQRQNLGWGRRLRIRLEVEVLTSATDGDDDADEVGDPSPPLPEVHGAEPEKRDGEGDHASDDDTHFDGDACRVQRRQGLPAHDRREEREAGQRGGIEKQGDGYKVEAVCRDPVSAQFPMACLPTWHQSHWPK
jgi:hypothetical protein